MRAAVPTYVLAAWTLLTWGTRIRNAAADGDGAMAFVVPGALVVVAAAAVVRPDRWTRLLGVSVSAAWLVRVPVILAGDHDVSFKAVHTGLAAVTWALAWWALHAEQARRRATR